MKKRRKIKIIPFIIITLLILSAAAGTLYWFTCMSRPGSPTGLCTKQESQIRIATVNINGFRMLSSATTVADFLLANAQNSRTDILLLQEYISAYKLSTDDFVKMFKRQFPFVQTGDEYPYVQTEGEQAIASKYPIVSSETINFPDSPDSFASYLIVCPDNDTIHVVSVHLQTTGLAAMGGDSQSIMALFKVLTANDKVRNAQAQLVRDNIEAYPYPTIVTGDLNCIPLSKPYRTIRGGSLHDTFLEKGKGHGSTFRMLYDILRIDYIMHDSHFNCLDCEIQNDYISDHRMIVTTLQKRKK